MDEKYFCETCETKDDRKHAFGKFWPQRSAGGKGCDTQFPGWPKDSRPKRPDAQTAGSRPDTMAKMRMLFEEEA